MAKKLAVGRRKRVMAGKRSATKRELAEAGQDAGTNQARSRPPKKRERRPD